MKYFKVTRLDALWILALVGLGSFALYQRDWLGVGIDFSAAFVLLLLCGAQKRHRDREKAQRAEFLNSLTAALYKGVEGGYEPVETPKDPE